MNKEDRPIITRDGHTYILWGYTYILPGFYNMPTWLRKVFVRADYFDRYRELCKVASINTAVRTVVPGQKYEAAMRELRCISTDFSIELKHSDANE